MTPKEASRRARRVSAYVTRLRALGPLEYRERNPDGTWSAWWIADLAPVHRQVRRAALGSARARRRLRAKLRQLATGRYAHGDGEVAQQWRRIRLESLS